MIICKLFEIIKSYIIILSVDWNTHLHTLNEKTKHFWLWYHYWQKQGGAGQQVDEKRTFWATKISVWGAKIWLDEKKNVGLAEIFKDFLFESKTKKLCYFKVGKYEIFEKHGCPPPFETNATVRNTCTWDVRYLPKAFFKWL